MKTEMNEIPIPIPRPKNHFAQIAAPATRILIFAAALFSGGFLAFGVNKAESGLENFLYAQITQPFEGMVYAVPQEKVDPELDLDAKAALSLRVSPSGRERIIYRRNSESVLPIASLTKLMTAIIVVESPDVYDLARRVPISPAAAAQEDVPIFGNLDAGQEFSVRELLNKMLFYSSNDAAFALAEIMGQERFVTAMNDKAQQLDLADSIFYNPSGLDVGGFTNSSSAADLAILIKYVLNDHPEIFSIGMKPGPYLTENGIFSLKLWDGQTLVGGKTGYTELAGGCMVAVTQDKLGRRNINILLGSTSPQTRVVEMQKMINAANNVDPAAGIEN